jgi:hypothetical protein
LRVTSRGLGDVYKRQAENGMHMKLELLETIKPSLLIEMHKGLE